MNIICFFFALYAAWCLCVKRWIEALLLIPNGKILKSFMFIVHTWFCGTNRCFNLDKKFSVSFFLSFFLSCENLSTIITLEFPTSWNNSLAVFYVIDFNSIAPFRPGTSNTCMHLTCILYALHNSTVLRLTKRWGRSRRTWRYDQ